MSSLNWFDAFRDNSGPLLYHNNNRISATYDDVLNILIYICFITLFVAFLIISPGIRKERFCTTICITVSLFIGGVILSANFGASWHVAESAISSPYRAFTKERLYSTLGVKIGLKNVNVTLKAHSIHKNHEDINYNERFYFIEPSDMKKEHRKALVKGLPYPILTITEYLSQDAEGFCWGRRYRLAGHYANFLLWISFANWILMNILLCAVPRYGAYTMMLTGVLLLSTNITYALLLPKPPLLIPFEGAQLRFQLGWCFWAVCSAGFLALFVGAIYALLDTIYPNKFSTILEVDYDTPYRYFVGNDAHLLSSHDLLAKSPSSSKTNSTTTSCCGRQMLQKLKSDASTSTIMSIPINEKHKHRTSLSSNSHNIFQGKDNAAYEPELEQQKPAGEKQRSAPAKIDRTDESGGHFAENFNENEAIELKTSADQSKSKKRRPHQTTLNTSTASSSGDDGEVTTTIIDGKRAVSLHNFGKFAEQQRAHLQKSKQYLAFTGSSASQSRYFR